MSRFRISHPTRENIHCICGHDHMLGFFLELHREDRDNPIKTLDMFTATRAVTLQDCLDFMIDHGCFTRDQLHAALAAIQDGHLEPLPPGVARTVEIVVRFKGSAEGDWFPRRTALTTHRPPSTDTR